MKISLLILSILTGNCKDVFYSINSYTELLEEVDNKSLNDCINVLSTYNPVSMKRFLYIVLVTRRYCVLGSGYPDF